jgi:hypothetical protein
MKVDLAELRSVTDLLIQHAIDAGVREVELSSDYYWDVPAASRYDRADAPTALDIGQLSEDLTFLAEIDNGVRPPVAYGLVWVAALLRFVGEQVVR